MGSVKDKKFIELTLSASEIQETLSGKEFMYVSGYAQDYIVRIDNPSKLSEKDLEFRIKEAKKEIVNAFVTSSDSWKKLTD